MNGMAYFEGIHMRLPMLMISFGLLCVSGANALAAPAAKVDFGKQQYDHSCAACHGASGKGDGPVGSYLARRPPDLSVLAKNNGGVFPVDRVVQAIDGRLDIKPHGGREMPVWGTRFSIQAAEYYFDAPYESEAYVRGRMLSLADYLHRLQMK
jgi:mono/diheme cytochrome c family protein